MRKFFMYSKVVEVSTQAMFQCVPLLTFTNSPSLCLTTLFKLDNSATNEGHPHEMLPWNTSRGHDTLKQLDTRTYFVYPCSRLWIDCTRACKTSAVKAFLSLGGRVTFPIAVEEGLDYIITTRTWKALYVMSVGDG